MDNNNKKYTIYIKDINIMFGELIVYFYLISGLEFNDDFRFFYNNQEIPCYSSTYLSNLNIQNESQIFFGKRTSQMQIYKRLNIIFDFCDKKKILVIAHPYMLTKQLFLKFCQSFKHLYHHVLQKYRFTYNGSVILPDDKNLWSIGMNDCCRILVIKNRENAA